MSDTDIAEDCMETAREKIARFNLSPEIRDELTLNYARAITDERLRERELCCKAVCAWCGHGWDVSVEDGLWWHTDVAHVCEARAIRERSQ